MIFNQLSYVEIDFYDKVHALILLASLPNSWVIISLMKWIESQIIKIITISIKINFHLINDLIFEGKETKKK